MDLGEGALGEEVTGAVAVVDLGEGAPREEVEGAVAGGGISWRRRCRAAAPCGGGRAREEGVGTPRLGEEAALGY
jgi:hypothetical protein